MCAAPSAFGDLAGSQNAANNTKVKRQNTSDSPATSGADDDDDVTTMVAESKTGGND